MALPTLSKTATAQVTLAGVNNIISPSRTRELTYRSASRRLERVRLSLSKIPELKETSKRSVEGRARIETTSMPLSMSKSTPAKWISEAENATDAPLQLTYLEGNSWFWQLAGVKILIDPIMEDPLDFDIPWLYEAYKKITRDWEVKNVPPLDCLLITQSLDDHCHIKTLKRLSASQPGIRVVATPNAEPKLRGLFENLTFLEPGSTTEVRGINGSVLTVRATQGPILGPPWQRPESGYIVSCADPALSVYLEPHCVYDAYKEDLSKLHAHVVVTPVVRQLLPAFTLVSGQEDAVELAKLLKAKYVVPMANAELDAKGLLSLLVKAQGTVDTFEALLRKESPGTKLLVPTPGQPLVVPLPGVE